MNQYIGQRLGAYQLLEQIGQGGMATIYKAYQPSMDRYVAVKILPSHFTEDETFVARFTQEARTLARLEHPFILPVHDYGEQGGITYLVMRYIEAGTLKDLIAQQAPLSLNETMRILRQVGSALGYAHTQGVVHRDIKPTNVLIDRRGDAFLTDFGIAKLVAGTAQYTATGAIIGTPAYMSPEQGLGETVDHRSDIYALGVMLYEMVTGRVPFEAETPLAVLLKHVNDPLPPPRQVRPDLPEAVERVILKAMAKSPGDRYQTAEAMIAALEKAVAGLPTEPVLAVAPTSKAPAVAPERTAVAPARKALPWLPIAGGVAALALVFIVALLILPNFGGSRAEATPTLVRALAKVPTTAPPAGVELIATATAPLVGAQPPALAAPTPPASSAEPSPAPAGWTRFTNGNFARAMACQDGALWVGGEGGLVRWDLTDGSYVKLGVPDGLAASFVNDLLVDDDGNLWVATDAGVSLFDGEDWLTFDETDGLDSEEVQTLFLDHDGGLWAGTTYGERGLSYYDGSTWGPPPVPALPVEFPKPQALAMEANNGLWVGLIDYGLAYFDGDDWSMLAEDDLLPAGHVTALLVTEDDEVWVSFEYETYRRDPESGAWSAVPQLDGMAVYAIHRADDGSYWFGGDGVTRYAPDTGDWQHFEPRPGVIPDEWILSIAEDASGLWFGAAGGGVVHFDGVDWQPWITADVIAGNDVLAIRQDGDGVLWFIHDDGFGLSRYDPASDSWQTFSSNEGAFDWPSTPALDSHGHLWIAEYGQLKRYDGSAWQSFTPSQLTDTSVNEIAFGAGDVQWLSTDNGLMRHDPVADEWTTWTGKDHPTLEQVNVLYATSQGVVWAGGQDGLVYFDGDDWREPQASGDPPEYVRGIAEAPDGSLWVAADDDLYHLEDEQWIHFSWPGDGWIGTLAFGPDGAVWVGGYGLARFDPAGGDWQIFTTDDGLVDDDVQAIYVTADGVVWVGTSGGVSRYAPETGAPALGSEENRIVWVFTSSNDPETARENADRLAELLRDETGLYFAPYLAADYGEAIEMMCSRPPQAHMSILGPFPYVLAAERGCADAALVAVRFGSTSYAGQIIARADSGIASVADLEGKTFCRPDPLSTTGWILPTLTMQAAGIDPETDLAEIITPGSHDGVVAAVYAGECDAGATYVDARANLEETHPDVMEQVVVIQTTPELPNDGVQFHPGVPAALRGEIVRALLALAETDQGRAALDAAWGWDGLESHGDAFYDPFRDLLRDAGVDIEDLLQP